MAPSRSTRRAALVALAVAPVLTIAACSSGSDSSPPASTAPSTSATSAASTTTAAGSATTGAPTTRPPTSAAPTTAIADECTAADLQLTLDQAGAAAGTGYSTVVFTNRSTTRCSMRGYPGVSFVDASGHQIGPAAQRDATRPESVIPLAPGGQAHALVGVSTSQLYDPSQCGTATTATAIRVYPPDSTTAINLPTTVSICPNDVGQTRVQAVAAGATES